MSKKGDPKALARIDAKRLADEFEWAMEDPEYYSDWRNQIAYYRSMADKLPDQRRQIVQETYDENGKLVASNTTATPRAELEWQINDAERAAQAGNIGRYGLHIQAIVTTLHNAQLPTIEESVISRNQSSRSRGKPRRARWGTLRTVLEAMKPTSADDAMERWKAGPTIVGYRLHFEAGDDRPFKANGESFTKNQIRSKVSNIKGRRT